MKSNNTFQRGFTLIELMIVIVILGILMGTILPRLTGAQGRARDTSRRADLANLSQALEVYNGDQGKYPNGTGCLIDVATADITDTQIAKDGTTGKPESGKTVAELIQIYLKGNRIILPGTTNLDSNGCKGAYYYSSLAKGSVEDAAYVLLTQVETFQMANYDLTVGQDGPINPENTDVGGEYDRLSKVKRTLAAEAKDASGNEVSQNSVYILIP
jgi:prepilin-type N-terminal cleavage/methylation domain-containing protein